MHIEFGLSQVESSESNLSIRLSSNERFQVVITLTKLKPTLKELGKVHILTVLCTYQQI